MNLGEHDWSLFWYWSVGRVWFCWVVKIQIEGKGIEEYNEMLLWWKHLIAYSFKILHKGVGSLCFNRNRKVFWYCFVKLESMKRKSKTPVLVNAELQRKLEANIYILHKKDALQLWPPCYAIQLKRTFIRKMRENCDCTEIMSHFASPLCAITISQKWVFLCYRNHLTIHNLHLQLKARCKNIWKLE